MIKQLAVGGFLRDVVSMLCGSLISKQGTAGSNSRAARAAAAESASSQVSYVTQARYKEQHLIKIR